MLHGGAPAPCIAAALVMMSARDTYERPALRRSRQAGTSNGSRVHCTSARASFSLRRPCPCRGWLARGPWRLFAGRLVIDNVIIWVQGLRPACQGDGRWGRGFVVQWSRTRLIGFCTARLSFFRLSSQHFRCGVRGWVQRAVWPACRQKAWDWERASLRVPRRVGVSLQLSLARPAPAARYDQKSL